MSYGRGYRTGHWAVICCYAPVGVYAQASVRDIRNELEKVKERERERNG